MSNLDWPLKPYQINTMIARIKEYDEYIEFAYMRGDCQKLESLQANQQIVIDRLIAPNALDLA